MEMQKYLTRGMTHFFVLKLQKADVHVCVTQRQPSNRLCTWVPSRVLIGLVCGLGGHVFGVPGPGGPPNRDGRRCPAPGPQAGFWLFLLNSSLHALAKVRRSGQAFDLGPQQVPLLPEEGLLEPREPPPGVATALNAQGRGTEAAGPGRVQCADFGELSTCFLGNSQGYKKT